MDSSARDALVPALAPVSPAIVVIARDASSETRFGSGTWDRAVLARIVAALARAGATAIGVDIVPGRPGVPGRGGAASDALLAQAAAAAGNVVFIADPGAASAPGAGAPPLGHTVVVTDPDGVVRRVPLSVKVGERDVPALGLAVAAAAGADADAMAGRIPTDRAGRAQLRWAPDLPVVPIGEVWTAIETGGGERLQRLVEGKRVLLVTEPTTALRRTPIGPLSDIGIQVEVLNAALTGAWLRPPPALWTLGGTLLVAVLAAWLGLALGAGMAVAGLGLLALVVAALVSTGVVALGVVLPIVQPFAALTLAGVGALVWNQIGAARRLRRLEGEVAGIREHLVRQESAVETLEEDLEAARAAVARSTGAERGLLEAADALRGQLAAATAQEEQTRLRLHALERELRAADRPLRRSGRRGAGASSPAVPGGRHRHARSSRARPVPRPGARGAHHAADPARRRAGHRQGAVRARRSSAEPAGERAVRGGEHGGHPARPVRERDVRPREGQLHRRGRPIAGATSSRRPAGPSFWTRSARRAPSTRASSCACSRSARSSGSAPRSRRRWTSGWSPPATAISSAVSPRAGSARTSTSA